MAMIRPPIEAGPMLRQFSDLTHASGMVSIVFWALDLIQFFDPRSCSFLSRSAIFLVVGGTFSFAEVEGMLHKMTPRKSKVKPPNCECVNESSLGNPHLNVDV